MQNLVNGSFCLFCDAYSVVCDEHPPQEGQFDEILTSAVRNEVRALFKGKERIDLIRIN